MTELVKITGKIVRSGEEPINVEVIASAPVNRDAYDFDKDVNVPQELKNAVLNNSDFRKVGRIRSCVGLGDTHLTCYYVSGVTDTGVPGVTFALFNSSDNTVQTERLTQDLNVEYIYSMIDSKGFRDEERNVITIPGSSVKYPTELAGHLVQVGQNGMLEDGGEKGQFAKANHSHGTISLTESGGASAKVKAGLDGSTHEGYVVIELKNDQTQEGTTKTAQITMSNIEFLQWLLSYGIDGNGATDSTKKKVVTKGSLEAALVYIGTRLDNQEALLYSINARVSALETPSWSENGIDITSDRYDNNSTTNADAYNDLSIGDQVKVVVTAQSQTSTIYTIVTAKFTGPNRVFFEEEVYLTYYSSVVIYKRVS